LVAHSLCLEKGILIFINPDANGNGDIDNIRWGVTAVRKGGLIKSMTRNAMTLPQIEHWLLRKQANDKLG